MEFGHSSLPLSFSSPLSTHPPYTHIHIDICNIFTIIVCVPQNYFHEAYTYHRQLKWGVVLKSIFSRRDWFGLGFLIREVEVYLYTKDITWTHMASFKKWFYDQLRLLNTAYHDSLLQNHGACFHTLGNPAVEKQFNFLNPEFPKHIWP